MTGKEPRIRPGILRKIEKAVKYFSRNDVTVEDTAGYMGQCYATTRDLLRRGIELGYMSEELFKSRKVTSAGRPETRTFYPTATEAAEDSSMRKAVRMRKRGAKLQEIADALGNGKSSVFYMLSTAMNEGLLKEREYDRASRKNLGFGE